MNPRNSSTSKKRNQHDKFLQSRVLINSNSLNPLSKHISSKLDLIKQEISRQFHEKFPSERKRTTSVKKNNSSSKLKIQKYLQNESISKKLNFGDLAPTAPNMRQKVGYQNTIQQSQNQNFRQKFYELQDKFMDQRKKSIDDFQRTTKMKQTFLDFLQQPSNSTFQSMKEYFPADRQQKIIQKFINMNEDVEYAEKVLTELLSIMQTEDIETLLVQLKSRQAGYKSLSQCTFRIVELETANNKVIKQCQQKIEKTINQYRQRQQELKNEMQQKMLHVHTIIESARKQEQQAFHKMVASFVLNINKMVAKTANEGNGLDQNRKYDNFMYVTFDKAGKDSSSSKKRPKSASSIIIQNENSIQKMLEQVEDIVNEMQNSLQEIQKQAELNADKLSISKQDMNRLQKLIESVSYQTQIDRSKLIEHFENTISQMKDTYQKEKEELECNYNTEKEKLKSANLSLSQMSSKLESCQQQLAQQRKQNEKKQQITNKIIKTVCEATGQDMKIFGIQVSKDEEIHSQVQAQVQQIVISKIQMLLNKHLLLLKQDLQSAQNMILWHEKELQIKENLLKQFEFNLKKLVEDAQSSQQKQKKLQFQRDQYKYLLNNLRESVRQMKIQHSEQLKKVEEQKDQQYLHSNKDILQDNKRLNEQITKLQSSINQMSDQIKAESTSNIFYRKKSQQLQTNIVELRKKLSTSEAETNKYKQHLSQIQLSFKQVQNLSEINSHKMINLQQENKMVFNQAAELRAKVQSLQISIQTKDESYGKLQYSYDQLKKRNDNLLKNKQDLENQNSQLRLKSLEILEQIRERDDRLKKIQFENGTLTRQNKKLMEQVNQLTKKLLSYAGQKQLVNKSKNQITNEMRQKIRKQVKLLKDFYFKTKLLIKDYVEQCRYSMNVQQSQLRDQINLYFSRLEEQQRKTDNNHRNYGLLLKQQIKNEALVQKINLAIKTLKFVKNDIDSFKQYCKYIKSQLVYQINHVQQLISKPHDLLSKQSLNLQNNYEKLLKINLKFSSLKNQNEQMKQMIENFTKQIFAEFTEFIHNNMPAISNKSDQSCQQQKKQDDFNKYLVRKQSPTKVIQDQLLSNHDQMSPQFVKVSKESLIDKQDQSQRYQQIRASSDPKSQKQNKLNNNRNNHGEQDESLDAQYNQVSSQRVKNQVKNYSLKIKNSSFMQKEDQKLRWSGLSVENQQVYRVKKILQSLKYHDIQQLKIPYFESIKNEYMEVKKKLMAKNLVLDISAVSFRHNTISSPSSVSFSKDFLFDKRFNTQPNQQPVGIAARQTNRSQHKFDRNIQSLKKQNEQLRQQVEQLDQQVKIYEYREEQYKTTISELDKKKTQLQNEASKQMKEKLFLKFITDLCKQNWKEVESSCKIILKLLDISNQEIVEKMEALKAFILKFQKKGNPGFISGLFGKSSKG